MPQCTAKSKRSGVRCKRLASIGSHVCAKHGANAGAPIKHGRYSKRLPVRLAARYRELVNDKTLLQAQEHLALLELMLSDRLTKFGDVSSAELWSQAADAFRDVREALAEGDATKTVAALNALEAVLQNGLGVAKAEREARDLIQESVPVRRVEIQRLYAAETAVTAKEAVALMAAILDAVNRNVPDAEVRKRIAAEFVRLSA